VIQPRFVLTLGDRRRAFSWAYPPEKLGVFLEAHAPLSTSTTGPVKRHCLPGRTCIDQTDFDAPLAEWNATLAEGHLPGMPQERPRDRFARAYPELVLPTGQPSLRLEARLPRIVAQDDGVSLETPATRCP
jgi:hypothetical protein